MKKNKPSRHKLKRMRSHSAERLHNDPAFENVRKNWQDFSTAARSAKLLRTVMENIMEPVHDRSRQWRLTKAMSQVLKADKTNPRGKYNPDNGDLKLLEGIELNTGASFYELLPESLLAFGIDKKKVKLQIWPVEPDSARQHPLTPTATDVEVRLAVADINFSQQTFNVKWSSSGLLPFVNSRMDNTKLAVKLDKSSRLPLFIFVAVNFYNEGFKERLNAISLVCVYTSKDYQDAITTTTDPEDCDL